MLYLLSTAHSACAHSFTCSLHNRKLVYRMCALAFHRAIALHLVFLHALVLINTCSELDSVVGLTGTHATLTMAGLCIHSLARHFLRLVMGPANAVAPPSTHGGKPLTSNKTIAGPPRGTLPIPTGPTAQRLSESVSGEAGPQCNSEQWNYQSVLWSGPKTGESVAMATFVSFHGKGGRQGTGERCYM